LTKTIRESKILPFHRLFDWVIKNPLSKKFPKGFVSCANSGQGKRNGRSSIEVFCEAWEIQSENWPGITRDSDWERFQLAFDLRDSIFPEYN